MARSVLRKGLAIVGWILALLVLSVAAAAFYESLDDLIADLRFGPDRIRYIHIAPF